MSKKESIVNNHPVFIYFDKKDEAFIVESQEILNVIGCGDTEKEAIEEFTTHLNRFEEMKKAGKVKPINKSGRPQKNNVRLSCNISDVSKNDFYSFIVYPNPFNEFITLSYISEEESSAKALLIDSQGRKVWESDNIKLIAGSNKIEFNINNITSGIYYLRVETDYENRFMKVIKY